MEGRKAGIWLFFSHQTQCWNFIRSVLGWLINLYSPPAVQTHRTRKGLWFYVFSTHAWVCVLLRTTWMRPVRVIRQLQSVNSVLLLYPFAPKNSDHRGVTATSWVASPFLQWTEMWNTCSHSVIVISLHADVFANTVDHISNGVFCEGDIMQCCVRPVYTT